MAAAQLDELKRLGSQLNGAAFVCGGSVDPLPRGLKAEGCVTVWYRDATGQLGEVLFPPQDVGELERLVAACVPATFGRGDQDVLDPTYRQAVRLEPDQFMTSFNLAEFPILEEVQRVIGGSGGCLRAILHKLNVYTKGGFFKAHRDTPRTPLCVGTIVVCLPTAFQGGEFVVKNADGSFSHTFDWGASVANGKVQWCAFYSDCEHEVLPVHQGHRVTLTYVLEYQPLQHPMLMDAQPFTAFGERLVVLLKDPTFAPHGTKLGFGLQHQYIVSEQRAANDAPQSDQVLVSGNDATVPLMKGADRVLKETLDRLGLQYAFVPVYATNLYRAPPGCGNLFFTSIDKQLEVVERTYDGEVVPVPTEWQFPFPTDARSARQGAWRGDDEKELFVSDWGTYIRPDDSLDYGPPMALDFSKLALYKAREIVWIVRPTNFPYLKSTIVYGNEHSLGHNYAAACFLVYVPPSDKRGDGKPKSPTKLKKLKKSE